MSGNLVTTTDPPLSTITERFFRFLFFSLFFLFIFCCAFSRLWLEIKMLPILCCMLNFISFLSFYSRDMVFMVVSTKSFHTKSQQRKNNGNFFCCCFVFAALQRVCCILHVQESFELRIRFVRILQRNINAAARNELLHALFSLDIENTRSWNEYRIALEPVYSRRELFLEYFCFCLNQALPLFGYQDISRRNILLLLYYFNDWQKHSTAILAIKQMNSILESDT